MSEVAWGLCVLFFLAAVGGWIAFAVSASSSSEPCPANASTVGSVAAAALASAFDGGTIRPDLVALSARLDKRAAQKGVVEYADYAKYTASHVGKRIKLRQRDFARGTVRIRTAGVFVLQEDIEFSPDSFEPLCTPPQHQDYCDPAYHLGFFAAITVEAPDVVLDLNGFTFSQSVAFALHQAFYTHVSLSSSPFKEGEGPFAFTTTPPRTANGVVIRNGTFARSSHHAIHGVGKGRRVLVHDIVFDEYTVAAIALNGFETIHLHDLDLRGSRTSVPALGTFSQARFALMFARRVLKTYPDAEPALRQQLEHATDALHTVFEQARIDITQNPARAEIDRVAHPEAYDLFAARSRLIDGNNYGIVLHAERAAVNAFGDVPVMYCGAIVERVRIANTRAHIIEVVPLARASDNITMRGPVADLIRITSNDAEAPRALYADEAGTYRPSPLSEVQLALVEFAHAMPPEQRGSVFNTLTMRADAAEALIDWRHGRTTLAAIVGGGRAVYKRNGDSMFHVNKGPTAFRIDSVTHVLVRDVVIDETHNFGQAGILRPLPGETNYAWYRNADDGGHPMQGAGHGYMGADVRGLALAAVEHVTVANVSVCNTHSERGMAFAVDVLGHSKYVTLRDVTIANVTTDAVRLAETHSQETGPVVAMGYKMPVAVGLHVDEFAQLVRERITLFNISSGMQHAAFDEAHEPIGDTVQAFRNVYEL